ncbi:RNA-binding protein 5-like isoform X3 [Bradysia coprophila]|uniref:RNA-binding protein 5-like isoform X3 n=1 Tax=Bradysia coprophila TaxID=38358 RepID=UPI00187DA7D8|nr:RNA-binding protein 5-like isoform X3 [Bradysia coprophila]
MDRRSRSPDSRHRRRDHRRRSRSRSRDRSRDRRRRSRSRSRPRYRRNSPDLYKDLIDQDYQNDRDRDRHHRRHQSTDEAYLEEINSNDSFDSDQVNSEHYRNQVPSNKIIILGLAQHITETDINNDLIHYGLQPVSIRLIRKRKTGASRGFAFVEFNTEEEARSWMEYKQGVLMVQDQYRSVMQYSVSREPLGKEKVATDWYCAKCGVFNFKRRENCFKCYASREESEKGGEGSDEVSNILTKKIMLRNLDVLTNEEGVLTVMQEVVPSLVSKISKILICKDPLTCTSRGICYLSFENLVDSMSFHNALKAIEPALNIEDREVLVSYCVDSENKQINKSVASKPSHSDGPTVSSYSNTHQYTLADVPRLAEYSASVYASNSAEHDHYYKYYTDYYIAQITNGHYNNLPTMGETANSGAAVAMSAIQRKQKQQNKVSSSQAPVTQPIQIPTGLDNKKYPAPDVFQYQYDESSGFYYDSSTGLYYDSSSQYYYNGESGAYLYWNAEKSTYTIAATTPSTPAEATKSTSGQSKNSDQNTSNQTTGVPTAVSDLMNDSTTKASEDRKKDPKQDKVKVAKKIVKDMEKWAKQLNQKKDLNVVQAAPAPVRQEEEPIKVNRTGNGGYADVGFSILENKERSKISMDMGSRGGAASIGTPPPPQIAKLVSTYGSDSDNEQNEKPADVMSEKDYIDFAKLTCLLCKRAFSDAEILNKHLKMSNLHKENLQKYNLLHGKLDDINASGLSYRDRAKERRLKYGESDPPPVNRSRERFEKELEKQKSAIQVQASGNLASQPISSNNVGNRLLQKMGWSEGQGLGRTNQGRTNIIEAESRAPTAGLGTKTTNFGPGDDYKSYIKRMMKSRYEQQ